MVTGVSTVRVEPDDETSDDAAFTSTRPFAYVPGILLLIAVGVLGKYSQVWWNALAKQEHWKAPDIEYVLWAILIGLLITNTVGLHRIFRPGVQTYQFWLKVGIVALGARFVLGDIAKLGGASLVQILLDMTIAGTIIILAARAFGLSGKLGSLLAIGTSICGVSAIIAAKGAIRARNSDVSYAIAAILALGAVALFALPPLGHAIGLTDYEFGLWAGLSVDNTAETTATGYLFSDHAGKIAVLVKSTRNALIGFVVLGFAVFWASRGEADEIAPGVKAKAAFVWAKFPKFVLGFLAVSAIATAHWLSKGQTANL
ncbi:MAG: putative sulfate exporter family transporter, partial [Mycobacterium sp.]